MKQIEGQMSLFDFIPEPDPQPKWHLPCDTCGYDVKGCCDYNYHSGSYCVLGDKWKPKEQTTPAQEYFNDTGKTTYWQDSQEQPYQWWKKEKCAFSGHSCNKAELWKVADTLDAIMCPHVCCRQCNTQSCGARCNGAPEPKEIKDDYIRENPTCFYVFGHYLDREEGWHKVPEELPTFSTWQLVDVVVFGKKTGTAWMEHEKWEAQYWAFRSVDDRRDAETTEVLAWKLSEEQEDGNDD